MKIHFEVVVQYGGKNQRRTEREREETAGVQTQEKDLRNEQRGEWDK